MERDEDYLEVLVDLSLEGIREIDSPTLKLRLMPRDKDFIQSRKQEFYSRLEKRLEEEPEIIIADAVEDIIGGVIVTTPDERLSYINSFTNLLNRNWDSYRKEVVNKFLENENT